MSNKMTDKKFTTDPLDDAMRELMNICKQYDDKLSNAGNSNRQQDIKHPESRIITDQSNQKSFKDEHNLYNETNTDSSFVAKICDNMDGQRKHINDARFNHLEAKVYSNKTVMTSKPSIERLQKMQEDLQRQLDEVLLVSKTLKEKQHSKMDSMLDDGPSDENPDEDDELIEFQQIENDLKVTEINRQLSKIQEELRLTLYKQLLSNTSSHGSNKRGSNQDSQTHHGAPMRRNSAQTDESTPPSSSCSDEQTATSSGASTHLDAAKHSQDNNHIIITPSHSGQIDNLYEKQDFTTESLQQLTASNTCEFYTAEKEQNNDTNSDASSIRSNARNKSSQFGDPVTNNNLTDIDAVIRQINNFDLSDPPASSSTGIHHPLDVNIDNPSASNQDYYQSAGSYSNYQVPSSMAGKDLERIEEGDEDDQNYCNSDKMRAVYEEKLSPIIKAGLFQGNLHSSQSNHLGIDPRKHNTPKIKSLFHRPIGAAANITGDYQIPSESVENYPSSTDYYDKFNPNNVNSARRSNRPLTMYLPKPDEVIDLIEHIQALGHDIAIISHDLKVTASTASGCLHKACSSNPKKWLKRFFYFDREAQILSYHENQDQLVKRNSPPKNRILFDEISDVYVDHSLSDINGKKSNSKRGSYVFVLVTTRRKFVLSTLKAEVMRAWIDILFTAAKANNSFIDLDNNVYGAENNDESHYSSIAES